jgi:type II secretory pathway component GspD/PulD (secretin)
MALAPEQPEKDRLNGGLNKLGAEGWELVAASGGEYVFKRPAGRTPQVRTGARAEQRNAGPRRPIADAPGFKTFQLKNASAADMERLLAKMFAGGGRADGGLRIASYEPTNSVIVWGTPPQMEAIEALLNRLDTPEGGKAPPRK